ncbi:Aste57867_15816 [Aphanomyces stellatus]|uniref:Aste57867_15816 protein n=1 Tax=Aphanomyces stellatus TaxID=120398 RepID=A0A485L5B1_9STRA|nr:hypothetical protein As57867_015760 [Aphanomyces stellatus]VFT92604.1 Aste57867_15816 [Aphanomyces stellatus]
MALEIGQRCEISGKRRGEVAYIGPVHSIPSGDWAGIRLDLPFGKNDGTQGSQRYFDCAPLHGVFVRPDAVNVSGSFPPFLVVQDNATLEEKVRLVEDARAAQRETTMAQKAVAAAATDSTTSRAQAVDAFWADFTRQEADVRRALESFTSEGTTSNSAATLDALSATVQSMRERAGAATLFLPPYDIRATQTLTARLLHAVESKRAPRKKFTFTARAKLKPAFASSLAAPDALSVTLASSSSTATENSDDHELVYADQTDAFLHITAPDAPDLSLARLSHCVVVIPVATSAIRGHDLKHCTIYTGPIAGSLWLDGCVDCTFVVACRQLRVHHTTATTFYLRIKSHPIVEDCDHLAFAPYDLRYDGLETQLAAADLARETALWAQVHDFKWLRQTQSPHWHVLPEAERPSRRSVPAAAAPFVSRGEST